MWSSFHVIPSRWSHYYVLGFASHIIIFFLLQSSHFYQVVSDCINPFFVEMILMGLASSSFRPRIAYKVPRPYVTWRWHNGITSFMLSKRDSCNIVLLLINVHLLIHLINTTCNMVNLKWSRRDITWPLQGYLRAHGLFTVVQGTPILQR